MVTAARVLVAAALVVGTASCFTPAATHVQQQQHSLGRPGAAVRQRVCMCAAGGSSTGVESSGGSSTATVAEEVRGVEEVAGDIPARFRPSQDQHDDEGEPWTEFEDWLLQDTYARYAIGSGRHVLWNRMVMEVPELIGRTPAEARRRWLHVTGRTRGTNAAAAAAAAAAGVGAAAATVPDVEGFYLQPPLLHEWEELPDGSFEGRVHGLRGVADGVAVRTRAVDPSGRRVADQYVRTDCGTVFELGTRRGAADAADAAAAAAGSAAAAAGSAVARAGPLASSLATAAPLLALASMAAVAGATVLTHHVQLEVFVV